MGISWKDPLLPLDSSLWSLDKLLLNFYNPLYTPDTFLLHPEFQNNETNAKFTDSLILRKLIKCLSLYLLFLYYEVIKFLISLRIWRMQLPIEIRP